MEERFENIDLMFQDELKNFSPEIPAGTWEKIAINIPARKKRAILPLAWKIAAGIAAIVSLGVAVNYIIEDKQKSNEAAFAVNKSEKENILPTPNSIILSTEKTIIADKKYTKTNYKSNNHITQSSVQDETISNQVLVANQLPENELVSSQPEVTLPVTESESEVIIAESAESFEDSSVSSKIVNQPYNNQLLAENSSDDFIYEDIEDEGSKLKWLIGGQAGPQYSYRNISSESVASDKLSATNSNESGVVAYAGGVNVEMKPTSRFSIQSGIYYSKIGLEQSAVPVATSTYSNTGVQQNPNNGISSVEITYRFPYSSAKIVVTSKESEKITQPIDIPQNVMYGEPQNTQPILSSYRYYEYLEIPFTAKYSIIDRKIGLHVLSGISTNVLMKNSGYVDDINPSETKTVHANALNFSSIVGIGMSYSISSKISMSIEPQFKYFLNKQVKQSDIDIHPYSIGVFTGVKYLF